MTFVERFFPKQLMVMVSAVKQKLPIRFGM